MRVGILHPGEMGSAVALTLANSGHEVYWASSGRSSRTRERSVGLLDAQSVAGVCKASELVISVCPPEFATSVAAQVLDSGYRGAYVDANAVSPDTKFGIAEQMQNRGVRFVDGGIIGLAPKKRGQTWLYLSGPDAQFVACCFTAGPIEAQVIGTEIGKASALKMCFAAYSKGSVVLLSAVLGVAKRLGVLEELRSQWARTGPSLEEVEGKVTRSAPKAWRWIPEMHEIAATFRSVDMPPGFHEAAADVLELMREFKDRDPSLHEILERL